MKLTVLLVALVVLAGCGSGSVDGKSSATNDSSFSEATLRVSGSTTVNPVAADAAEILRAKGLTVTVDSQGGSAGGITQLGAGQVEIAMSSKALADSDRAAFPKVDFVATEIGRDAVGVIVRREVVDGGVKSLNREQLKGIFEGRIRNWSEVGGPNLEVFVYDKEPGRGTREVLDAYLYGKGVKAPPPPQSDNYAVVGGNEETRAKLLSTPGSVGPLSSSFIAAVSQLAAVSVDEIEASPANVADGKYPMARPLFLITDGPPAGDAKGFIDYVVGPEGQKLLNKHGYLSLADLLRS
ncbi:MAG: phosphate ABC transporter substrate-binding protein [Pseudonocardiaceae bacterium]